jgi:hypothetical protein
MPYTDEDIYDLMDDISTIGAADTPEETIAKIAKDWEEYKDFYSQDLPPAGRIINFFLTRGISHTYRVVVFPSQEKPLHTLLVYPVVRGQYMATSWQFGSIDSLKGEISSSEVHYDAKDLKELQDLIKGIRENQGIRFPDKYGWLFEEHLPQVPAASESIPL